MASVLSNEDVEIRVLTRNRSLTGAAGVSTILLTPLDGSPWYGDSEQTSSATSRRHDVPHIAHDPSGRYAAGGSLADA